MTWILVSVIVLFLGGLAALASGRRAAGGDWIGPGAAVLACAVVFVQSLGVLCGGQTVGLRLPWSVPLGSLNMAMDPLSAVFALPIALVGALAAIYGREYLRRHAAAKNLGTSWFLFNLLLASMFLVVIARNGLFFLVAWEIMSLASFFLVMFEGHEERVRRSGWIYLVATHLGAAVLLAMFAILARGAPTLDFESLRARPTWCSCWRFWASAPRPDWSRFTFGSPRRTRPPLRTSRP